MTNDTSEFLEESLLKIHKNELKHAETQEEKNQINQKFAELDRNKILSELYNKMTLNTTNHNY